MAKHRPSASQMVLPGVTVLVAGDTAIPMLNRRIPHRQILQVLQRSREKSFNIMEIYRREVLPGKTRTLRLLGRKCPARIIHTLLGFEVQASSKRVHCPDLVTARYAKLFTELGCRSIRLPYDPTVTSRIIPQLESAVEQLSAGVRELFPGDHAVQLYVLRRLYSAIRSQLLAG